MGNRGGRRGGKRRYQRKDFKHKREDRWGQDGPDGKRQRHYDAPREMENAAFNEYYQRQGIVPAAEWDAMVKVLRQPLPVTFRINDAGHFARALRDKLKGDFVKELQAESIVFDGERMRPPFPLPWVKVRRPPAPSRPPCPPTPPPPTPQPSPRGGGGT